MKISLTCFGREFTLHVRVDADTRLDPAVENRREEAQRLRDKRVAVLAAEVTPHPKSPVFRISADADEAVS